MITNDTQFNAARQAFELAMTIRARGEVAKLRQALKSEHERALDALFN
jgi:hypothetical protein